LFAEYVPSKSALPDTQKERESDKQAAEGVEAHLDKRVDAERDSELDTSGGTGSSKNCTPATLMPCDRGRIVAYRYYVWSTTQIPGYRSGQCLQADRTLGDAIESLCTVEDDREKKCEKEGCTAEKGEHRKLWIHGGVRVMAEVCAKDGEVSEDRDGAPSSSTLSNIGGPIVMWASCAVCKKETERKKMSDGA
jgi:1-phosphatidylinositol-3-phosphate 5-kinase